MWIITKDLVEDGRKADTSSCNYDESKSGLLIHHFRLLDDDGKICFEG